MATIRTACTYDCPDACALLVETGRDRITIRGDPGHPITRGFVCHRIRGHPRRLESPDRLTAPLIRRGDELEPAGWDAALDLVAGKLAEALDRGGAPSVVHLAGGGSLGVKKQLVGHFFRSLGPVTTVVGGVCDECGKRAQELDFGERRAHDYTDLANAAALVLWGKNPSVTSPHLVPFIRELKARGKPVTLIEVLPTPSRHLADRVIPVAPSGDGFLALAVLRWLIDRDRLSPGAVARTENFEAFAAMLTAPGMEAERLARRAGVDSQDVEALAELYATLRPVATWIGWGLQRRRSGGRSVRCIDALAVLTGHVGIPGGGVNYGPGRTRGLDKSVMAKPSGRTIAAPTFGRDLAALEEPEAAFVYIQGANPVCQFADGERIRRALSAPFVVVADAFLTDTAAAADVILPVTLMLEDGDDAIGSFGHHHVARVHKAVDPPADVREDVWIARELNRRLGRVDDALLGDPAAAVERMTAPWFEGRPDHHVRNPRQHEVPFADGFDTPSGRMRLVTELPEEVGPQDGYPLVFMTVKPRRYEHSQVPAADQQGPIDCYLHPDATGAASIGDGARARLVSSLGAMEVCLRFDAGMRTDVCRVDQGGWLMFGWGVNALVADVATDYGGGTAFYDQRVRIEPCAP